MFTNKSTNSSNILKSLTGFIISLACLYLVYQSFSWKQFLVEIKNINYFYLALSVICLFITIMIRGLRWKKLFTTANVNAFDLSKAELIGFWGNSIFPLRLGELIRTHYAKRLTHQKYTTVIGTIIIERVIDMILIMPFLFVFYYFFPMELINSKINFLIILFILLIILLIFIRYFLSSFRKNLLEKIDKDLIKNLFIRKNSILFLSFLIWGLVFIDVYLVQLSMDLNLSAIECLSIMIIATIVYSVPSSPGTIGTFHLAIQEFMVSFLDQSIHVSQVFAFILHAHSYLFFIIVGTLYFLLDSKNIISFKEADEIH